LRRSRFPPERTIPIHGEGGGFSTIKNDAADVKNRGNTNHRRPEIIRQMHKKRLNLDMCQCSIRSKSYSRPVIVSLMTKREALA